MMKGREHIGTIVLATIFAVLIWLWAEGENREERNTDAEISFVSSVNAGQYLLRIRNASSGAFMHRVRINLEIQGPNRALQLAAGSLDTLVIPFEDTTDGTEVAVDLLDAIQNLPAFESEGITVLAVTPAQVTVRVDELIDIRTPVTVDLPGYEFETLNFEPAEVMVRLPNETWRSFVEPEFGTGFVIAELPEASLRALRPGESKRLERVGLRFHERVAGLDAMSVEPTRVAATVMLASRQVEIDLSVPVKVVVLPSDHDLYNIQIAEDDSFIRDVVISGEADAIERVQSGAAAVQALVNLTSDELQQQISEKEIEWLLPPGISARMKNGSAGARPTVPITITPRSPETAE